MEILNLIVGLFMIGIGFIVKFKPYLIAGYSSMPVDKQKNVDLEGLSSFMHNGLFTIGVSIIAGFYLFKWLGFTMIANSMILLVTLFGVTYLVIKAQRFDHNKEKKTKLIYIFLVSVTLLVAGLLTYGFISSKVIFTHSSVRFTGMYGAEIKVSEINDVQLADKIPAIKMRTNGFALGPVKKGFFNLDVFGNSRLLVHSDTSPYLIISKNDGEKVIINFSNKSETEGIFNEIKELKNN